MPDFNTKDLDRECAVDARPVWNTPKVMVADINTLTQTAGFGTQDAPASFGS
jgi:hypothetical protein